MKELKEISRVQVVGNTLYARIPKRLLDYLAWRDGDKLACSTFGTKLIFQRIPMEKFANVPAPAEEGGQG